MTESREREKSGGGTIPASRHDREIHENMAAWRRKPALRSAYRDFHRRLAKHLSPGGAGITLELGSGLGSIKETLPECVTSDIFPNPWLDRQENAYALSCENGAVANLILFDVWHHLQYPGTALAEFARVVRPGGRVVIFDPDMSLTGRILYRAFHHEPLGWDEPVTWTAPSGFDPARAPYFAAQASAYRIFVRGENSEWRRDWSLAARQRLTSFAYAASGGFRGPQLYPPALAGPIKAADRLLSLLPAVFSHRILIVLERTGSGSRI